MTSFKKAILSTWLIAGTLDILSAFVHVFIVKHKIFWGMFNYIASGLLGPDVAMPGGFGIVILGFFIHYFIAFSFTLLFFLVYRSLHFSRVNKYIVGILYGLFVWAVMNIIILPITKLPSRPLLLKNAVIDALILICMIGLPISIRAHSYFRKAASK